MKRSILFIGGIIDGARVKLDYPFRDFYSVPDRRRLPRGSEIELFSKETYRLEKISCNSDPFQEEVHFIYVLDKLTNSQMLESLFQHYHPTLTRT